MATKWKAYCLGSEGYQVRYEHEGMAIMQYPKEERYPVVERMGGSFESQKANAHLIAAAPTMLETLKASYHHFSPLLSHGNAFDRAMLARMYQLIAETEGKPDA